MERGEKNLILTEKVFKDIAFMEQNKFIIDGPIVSVIIPTYNRPNLLSQAIKSAINQIYTELQIIVVNDGGCDVSSIIKQFSDSRIQLIDRRENRGKAYSLNEAIAEAKGKYIAYLDDDDIYYPDHINCLVEAMENNSDCQAAYSDSYKTYYQILPDGSRIVLSKVLESSRDFDRMFILYFPEIEHLSLMHTKEILDKTGTYNEQLRLLTNWDMIRRLVFYTDFYHVARITGEFFRPAEEDDRITYLQQRDTAAFLNNFLSIRTARPAKPWPKLKDLSIILSAQRLDRLAGKTVSSIWKRTFYPYKLYIPFPKEELSSINTDMPNLVFVPVEGAATPEEQIDEALKKCEGDFAVIVPADYEVDEMWVEEPLNALMMNKVNKAAYSHQTSSESNFGAVFNKDELLEARQKFPNLPIQDSAAQYGIDIKNVEPQEMLFRFDGLLKEAKQAEQNGNVLEAAEIFEDISSQYKDCLWADGLYAGVLFKTGEFERCAELVKKINAKKPTVDTLMLEAKIYKESGNYPAAIGLLERARVILKGDNPNANN